MDIAMTIYDDDGSPIATFSGNGYAVRCAAAIAEQNYPDARWAFEVLNRYGHFVQHEADRETA